MVGCSVFVAFVLAIAALAVALRAQRRAEMLEKEVGELRRLFVGWATGGSSVPRSSSEFVGERVATPEAVDAAAEPLVAAPPQPVHVPEEPRGTRGTEEPPPPPPAAPPPPVPAKPPFDWESLIGVRLFSWIAGIALVLAMIFLLKYGVEHGWLRPAVRAAFGLATGITLLIVCEMRIARDYKFTANAMHGAGIAILYATLFALHGRWQLWPAWAAFLGMLIVTAAAVWLSVRRDSVFIALLGLLGGFATPALLSSGENRPIALFSYLLLLNGGMSWIAYRKRWPLLTALSVALTVVYQWSWVAKFLNTGQLPLAAAVFVLFALVGAASLLGRSGEKPFERIATIGAALPLLFAFFTAIVPEYGARFNVLFGFLLLVTIGLAAISLWRGPEWLHTLGGGATGVTFAIWLMSSYTHQSWPWSLLWLGVFVALFLAVGTRLQTIAVQTAGVLFFVLIGLAIREPHGYALQLTAMFVLLIAVAAYAARYENRVVFIVALVLSSILVGGLDDTAPSLRLAAILGVAAIAVGVYAIRPSFVHAAYTALFLASIVTTVTGADSPSFAALTTTHAVILLGILGVAWTSERHGLVPASLVFTSIAMLANDPADPHEQLLFAFVFYTLYILYALLLGARVKQSLWPHLAAALASAVFFLSAHDAFDALGFGDVIGLLPLALAAVMVLLLWRLTRLGTDDQRTRLALVAGTALAFITVAIPLQLENEWITISWALEAAALAWLFRRIPHQGLLVWSAALAAAVFVRLVLNPEVYGYHPRTGSPIFNWYLYAYVACAAALFLTAYLFPKERREASGAIAGSATLILFVLLNIEIADFYSAGDVLTFNFLSSSLAQDLTYTMSWAIFAIGVLIAGIALRNRPARVAALVLLVVTILKCFLHDLGRLGGLYRVGSLFGLAVSLVVVGILLQKFVMARQRDAV
ncbi:MAG TPA: DUF2339 domain-containing protein [Thermoanaerobaculia bacterium]|jgi:uncharacterized membrane protein